MIEHALAQLHQHGSLTRVGEPTTYDDGSIRVEIDVLVGLPSRAAREGVSATGVRKTETCTLVFSRWPQRAPRPYLRQDFPLDLPHINPYSPGSLVSPCIFEGSLDELMHRLGLDAVIDQLIDWLTKAASGTLIDPSQGWEPTRRDYGQGRSLIIASAENLIAATPQDGSIVSFQSSYLCNGTGIEATLDSKTKNETQLEFIQKTWAVNGNDYVFGRCAAFAMRAPVHEDGSHVFFTYQPESVVDAQSLYERAESVGVDSAKLQEELEKHYRLSVIGAPGDAHTWKAGFYVIVILLIERPMPLIGAPDRKVEVLPYVVRFNVKPEQINAVDATAHPALHSHSLTPTLLAQTAGKPASVISKKVALVGVGSLGSKLGLHLARSGIGKLTLIDDDSMSPHNAARHALLSLQSHVTRKKAEMMRSAISELSQDAIAYPENVVGILGNKERFEAIFPDDVELVIDSTASLQVLSALSSVSPFDSHRARLVRAQLYASGRCALLMFEGKERSARVDDLNVLFFEISRHSPNLRKPLTEENSDLSRLFVGDNCRSLTMKMSDSTISRAAAAMALKLENWLDSGGSEDGEICIGIEDPSGLGMNWMCQPVKPTTVIPPKEEGGWTVRVLSHVADAINADSLKWGALETGGALIGRMSSETRTITVSGLIPAPPDSKRKPAAFVLGVEGLSQELRTAHRDSVGHLMFVGTWHSHPMGGGHSGIDRETLSKIAGLGKGLPMLSLVWTPSGLICEVEQI